MLCNSLGHSSAPKPTLLAEPPWATPGPMFGLHLVEANFLLPAGATWKIGSIYLPLPSCFEAAFLANVLTHHPLCVPLCTSAYAWNPSVYPPKPFQPSSTPSLTSAMKASLESSGFGSGQLLLQSLCRCKSIIHYLHATFALSSWTHINLWITASCMRRFFLKLVLEETSNLLWFLVSSSPPRAVHGQVQLFPNLSLIHPFLSSSTVIQAAKISFMAQSPCWSLCLYHLFSSSLPVIALIHKAPQIELGPTFLSSLSSFSSLILLTMPWPYGLLWVLKQANYLYPLASYVCCLLCLKQSSILFPSSPSTWQVSRLSSSSQWDLPCGF